MGIDVSKGGDTIRVYDTTLMISDCDYKNIVDGKSFPIKDCLIAVDDIKLLHKDIDLTSGKVIIRKNEEQGVSFDLMAKMEEYDSDIST